MVRFNSKHSTVQDEWFKTDWHWHANENPLRCVERAAIILRCTEVQSHGSPKVLRSSPHPLSYPMFPPDLFHFNTYRGEKAAETLSSSVSILIKKHARICLQQLPRGATIIIASLSHSVFFYLVVHNLQGIAVFFITWFIQIWLSTHIWGTNQMCSPMFQRARVVLSRISIYVLQMDLSLLRTNQFINSLIEWHCDL